MSKTSIKKQDIEGLNIKFFGTLDFVLFLTYSMAQFFSGSVGDNFHKKFVLILSYLIQAAMFFALGIAGYHKSSSQ